MTIAVGCDVKLNSNQIKARYFWPKSAQSVTYKNSDDKTYLHMQKHAMKRVPLVVRKNVDRSSSCQNFFLKYALPRLRTRPAIWKKKELWNCRWTNLSCFYFVRNQVCHKQIIDAYCRDIGKTWTKSIFSWKIASTLKNYYERHGLSLCMT